MRRDIAGMVRAARKRQGMTQQELAQKIGVSGAAICDLETGDRKSPVSDEEMVKISDALHDQAILHEYCITCYVRKRISIRKFTPLNSIVPGAMQAAVKNVQKLTEATEMLSQLLPKMLAPGFRECPDFIEHRNTTVIKAIDVRRGLEILFDQLVTDKILTEVDLKTLEDVQQRLCVEKGYHRDMEG